ncbi:MAG: ankyrin repeat domain-containing protein [Alphaproteobacteria bacterium]
MAIPVTLTSRILNKIFSGRPRRMGQKLARVAGQAGHSDTRRRWRKLDTEDKIWAEMQRYLKKGAVLDVGDYDSRTALENAAARGHGDVVRKLVEHGADVNFSGHWRSSHMPLNSAAAIADVDIMRFLLSKGANPNHVNDYGDGALDNLVYASKQQPYIGAPPAKPAEAQECLKAMQEYGFVPTKAQKKNVFDNGPALAPLLPDVQAALDMKAAVEMNNMPALRQLLVDGVSADILADYHVETPLCHAATVGNLDMIELLVGAGAKVELPSPVTQYTPLQAATFNGQKEAFVSLLHKGADAKAPCAVKYDDPTTLDDVAKHSVNPRMKEFVDNVLDTIASAPPAVNTDTVIKVNKPLRIKQQMTP